MVESVLTSEKPGRQLAVRVLRDAVKAAREADRENDYQRLLARCDEALGALAKLPATAKIVFDGR